MLAIFAPRSYLDLDSPFSLMALRLPGFYYDPERNRYFPITSSTPSHFLAAKESSDSSSQRVIDDNSKRKKRKLTSMNDRSLGGLPSIRGSNLWTGMRSVRSNPYISFAERSHALQ